jgi:hypothetical protein
MKFEYDYDPNVEWVREWPTRSPADYDAEIENPDGLWDNDCSASRKECNGMQYYGGHNECARGHSFWRQFESDNFHPQTTGLVFTGRIWTIDSWDGEHFTVEMKDQNGNVLDSITTQGNNFASLGDLTLNCGNSAGHWTDGVFEISLRSDYDASMGDVTIRVTNTLDQDANDESIGYGDMRLNYEFDDGRPRPATADIDEDVSDPSGLWENNCEATVKTCQGHRYYGGANQCA